MLRKRYRPQEIQNAVSGSQNRSEEQDLEHPSFAARRFWTGTATNQVINEKRLTQKNPTGKTFLCHPGSGKPPCEWKRNGGGPQKQHQTFRDRVPRKVNVGETSEDNHHSNRKEKKGNVDRVIARGGEIERREKHQDQQEDEHKYQWLSYSCHRKQYINEQSDRAGDQFSGYTGYGSNQTHHHSDGRSNHQPY